MGGRKMTQTETMYEEMKNALRNWCKVNIGCDADVREQKYPFTVAYQTAHKQMDMLGQVENKRESVSVRCGAMTTVKTEGTLTSDAKQLRQLITKAERLANMWYRVYMEAVEGGWHDELPKE